MTIRQYNMLGEFMRRRHTIDQALRFEQRTFGSLCKHKWIDYSVTAESFHITHHGEQEFRFIQDMDRLLRTNAKRPLSIYAPQRAIKVVSIRRAA